MSAHNVSLAKKSHLVSLSMVRELELQCALSHFPRSRHDAEPLSVLEIGAGTGQQAQALRRRGYKVIAIDLPDSHYRDDRVSEVIDYDGRLLPSQDASVDVVFSSNVLEHVRDIDSLLEETKRVTAPGGIFIHILPSSACRAWSIPAHYIWLARRLLDYLLTTVRIASATIQASPRPRKPVTTKAWLGTFFPLRHGERGVTITEPYYFSRFWWKKKFREHDFEIIKVEDNNLFYTMANAFGESLGIPARQRLSRVLGSACQIYVLRNTSSIRFSDTQAKEERK